MTAVAVPVPAHLDPASAVIVDRLVPDGAWVEAFDPVVDLVDDHGTECEAVAERSGFLTYDDADVTGGIIAWLHNSEPSADDRHRAQRPAEPSTTSAAAFRSETAYSVRRWVGVPPIGEDETVVAAAMLVEGLMRASAAGSLGRPAVSVTSVRRGGDPVRVVHGEPGARPRIDVELLSTSGCLLLPPAPEAILTVTISRPIDDVVAVPDPLGVGSIAVRPCSDVAIGYRPGEIEPDAIDAFGESLLTFLVQLGTSGTRS